ncbi:YchJ family metal-binding protein [Mycolicibacterium sp. CBMA 295]|uniref:YchJ family metal-binding protein n=1 Tax=Mycolicibacterium sp. CBMA 295 TaxID=2606605 RepID=UPI0035CC1E63
MLRPAAQRRSPGPYGRRADAVKYVHGGGRHILHERSRFERVEGQWRYLDGDIYE